MMMMKMMKSRRPTTRMTSSGWRLPRGGAATAETACASTPRASAPRAYASRPSSMEALALHTDRVPHGVGNRRRVNRRVKRRAGRIQVRRRRLHRPAPNSTLGRQPAACVPRRVRCREAGPPKRRDEVVLGDNLTEIQNAPRSTAPANNRKNQLVRSQTRTWRRCTKNAGSGTIFNQQA